MQLAVYLPLVVSLLAAVAARPLAERLPRRVAALLRPAPRRRLVLVAAALVLMAVCGLSVLDLHGLIEFAQAAA
jgi:predicted PurR-regulated permease PerM